MSAAENIHAGSCDCPEGYCADFVDPPSMCVHRLDGEVLTKHCPKCSPTGTGATWHHNGQCLRCQAREKLK